MSMRHGLGRSLPIGFATLVVAAGIAACGGSDEKGGDTQAAVAESCTPKHQFETVEPGVLTVSSYSYPPSTIVDGDHLGGLEGDLLAKVAANECLELKLLSQAGAGVIPAVQSGRADLAAGGWYRTEERTKLVNLSDPLFADQIVLVSRGGEIATVEDMVGKRIGSTEGNLFNEDVEALLGDDFKTYQTTLDAYQDLGNGRLDAVMDGGSGAIESIKKLPDAGFEAVAPPPDERVEATEHPGQINWPSTKGNDALTEALNGNIEELREQGEIERLLDQYGFPPEAADVGEPALL